MEITFRIDNHRYELSPSSIKAGDKFDSYSNIAKFLYTKCDVHFIRDGVPGSFIMSLDPRWKTPTWSRFFRRNISGLRIVSDSGDKKLLLSLWKEFIARLTTTKIGIAPAPILKLSDEHKAQFIKKANAVSKQKVNQARNFIFKTIKDSISHLPNVSVGGHYTYAKADMSSLILTEKQKVALLEHFISSICPDLSDEAVFSAWNSVKTTSIVEG